MTELRKTIEVPASTRDEISIQCDLCGAVARDGEWNRDGYARAAQADDGVWCAHDEVKIFAGHLTHFPDDSETVGEAFDCCPECFTDRVRPALLALGLKPRRSDVSW